jgi:hypothetical protein
VNALRRHLLGDPDEQAIPVALNTPPTNAPIIIGWCRKMASIIRITLLLCIIGCIAAAGCTSSTDVPGSATPSPTVTPGAPAYAPAGPQPAFTTGTTVPEKHFNSDSSCYFVVTGTVTNIGSVAGKNVVVRFRLIDTASNTVRSTETMLIPRFEAGGKKTFTIESLQGECDRSYRVDIQTEYDIV